MSEHLPIVAMYMAIGAARALKGMSRESYGILSDRNGGHIGIMEGLVLQVAKHVAQRLDERGEIEEWPGVFEYEVSEPLGVEVIRLADNDSTFSTMALAADHMIKKFFDQ
jgi:hypothetical protein